MTELFEEIELVARAGQRDDGLGFLPTHENLSP